MLAAPWPIWRPIPSTVVGGSSYLPTDRPAGMYPFYGGIFGLANPNFVFPTVAFHPLMNANNLRLREMISNSQSFPPSESSSSPQYQSSLYRYHPYLSPEKITPKTPESTVQESCRQWLELVYRSHLCNCLRHTSTEIPRGYCIDVINVRLNSWTDYLLSD